ncbi:NAD(P)-binding domain-containing protein [Candidatus Saccharibacteria bacterium]|nr:NAD(P)-binding domain-containing protein [Candidatus Saccharibacteria bacterium]
MVITESNLRDNAPRYETHSVIHELNPDLWASRYGEYDRSRQARKLDELEAVLSQKGIDPTELDDAMQKTRAFIEHSFDLYEGQITEPHDGSYAFVVPTRIERDNPDYSEEATEHFPALRYVDSETRARMLVGMCPFIIDRYGVDEHGKRGFMVFSPLFGDMMRDYGEDLGTLSSVAGKVINDTARFTRDKLGVSVVGLGAILPRLTNHGRDITVDGLHTTTGHGGTVHLIAETMRSAIQRGLIADFSGRLGIIGAGNIGSATADVILDRGIADSLIISDNKPERLDHVVADLQQKYPNAHVLGTLDNAEVIGETPGVVSAVTTTFHLDAPEWASVDLDGKFVLDDSQPGCFNPEALEARGAILAWVMGRDNTPGGLLTLEKFDYGSTGPASRNDVWGCQGEAGSVYLTGEYDAVINDLVTPNTAKRIGTLFELAGVGPAPLQRMGAYILGVS